MNPDAVAAGQATDHYHTADGRMAHPVDFDVAVTATEQVGSQGRVGIAGVFGAGHNESDSASRVSRLKFRIYMSLPTAK